MSMNWLLESLGLSIVSTFILLGVARICLRWVQQPADRTFVIQTVVLGSCLIPAMAISPWAWCHLPFKITESEASISLPAPAPNLDVPRPLPAAAPLLKTDPQPSFAVSSPKTSLSEPTVNSAVTSDPIGFSISWTMIGVVLLGGCFSTGLVFTLGEMYRGHKALQRLKLSASAAGPGIISLWYQLTNGRDSNVRLLVSNGLDSPLVFGLFCPTMLLPAHFVQSRRERVMACLAHEWSHILRHDLMTSRLVWFSQVLLWFQPVYWSLRNELRLCQDQLADDFAASFSRDPIQYSELLLEFARSQQQRSLTGSLALAHNTSHLTRRMTMLLDPQFPTRQKSQRRFLALSLAVTTVLAFGLTGIRLDASPQAETKPTASTDNAPTEAVSYTCEVIDKTTGQPIPNAEVIVRRSKLMNNSNDIIEETKHTTDAQGKYTVTIPPEQLKERYLYIELDVEHEKYAAKKGHGYAMSMILKNEKLGERPFFEKTELYPSGDGIVGKVLLPNGQPASGVKVMGFSMSSPRDFESSSFVETQTGDDGQFHINVIQDANAIYWVLPKDYAIVERYIGKERKNQGAIKLEKGIRTGGVVLDEQGKPVPNVAVNIDTTSNDTGELPVSSSLRRGAVTDEQGRFEFAPLPVGEYRLEVSDHRSEPTIDDDKRYPTSEIFVSQNVTISPETNTNSFKIQAAPTVTFSAQYLDSQGKPTTGHSCYLFGEMNGIWYHDRISPDREGKISAKIPRGLEKVRVDLSTNEHGALRYRLASDQTLQQEQAGGIDFGTADKDITGLEIIRYKAPIVLIAPVDSEGKTIKDAYVTAKYPWENEHPLILKDDHRSDLSFEHQQDGRFRTEQMLPDEDVSFTIGAKGFETQTIAPINLKEGEIKEISVTLQPSKQ